jgi:hypothetical protein
MTAAAVACDEAIVRRTFDRPGRENDGAVLLQRTFYSVVSALKGRVS